MTATTTSASTIVSSAASARAPIFALLGAQASAKSAVAAALRSAVMHEFVTPAEAVASVNTLFAETSANTTMRERLLHVPVGKSAFALVDTPGRAKSSKLVERALAMAHAAVLVVRVSDMEPFGESKVELSRSAVPGRLYELATLALCQHKPIVAVLVTAMDTSNFSADAFDATANAVRDLLRSVPWCSSSSSKSVDELPIVPVGFLSSSSATDAMWVNLTKRPPAVMPFYNGPTVLQTLCTASRIFAFASSPHSVRLSQPAAVPPQPSATSLDLELLAFGVPHDIVASLGSEHKALVLRDMQLHPEKTVDEVLSRVTPLRAVVLSRLSYRAIEKQRAADGSVRVSFRVKITSGVLHCGQKVLILLSKTDANSPVFVFTVESIDLLHSRAESSVRYARANDLVSVTSLPIPQSTNLPMSTTACTMFDYAEMRDRFCRDPSSSAAAKLSYSTPPLKSAYSCRVVATFRAGYGPDVKQISAHVNSKATVVTVARVQKLSAQEEEEEDDVADDDKRQSYSMVLHFKSRVWVERYTDIPAMGHFLLTCNSVSIATAVVVETFLGRASHVVEDTLVRETTLCADAQRIVLKMLHDDVTMAYMGPDDMAVKRK